MFSAIARHVKREPDGQLTILVEVILDRTQQSVKPAKPYTGRNVEAIQAHVQADLQELLDKESDAGLAAAIVGTLMGSI